MSDEISGDDAEGRADSVESGADGTTRSTDSPRGADGTDRSKGLRGVTGVGRPDDGSDVSGADGNGSDVSGADAGNVVEFDFGRGRAGLVGHHQAAGRSSRTLWAAPPTAGLPRLPHDADMQRAEMLVEMLPYISRWRDQTFVVKFGGSVMSTPDLTRSFAADVVLLKRIGINPVVVHGGGPQIGDLMHRLGKNAEFRDGLRVTDTETLDIARMVLVGKVNRDIVSAINVYGPLAVGVSGEDGRMLSAVPRNPSLGYVGEVTDVNTDLLRRLIDSGLIPVMSTIGVDEQGQAYNINADSAAGAVAEALVAEKAIFLTDVVGLCVDPGEPETLIGRINVRELAHRIERGKVSGGMIPKVEAALRAVRGGVRSAHMLDGRVPHVLLLELFTDAGVGTMIEPAESFESPDR